MLLAVRAEVGPGGAAREDGDGEKGKATRDRRGGPGGHETRSWEQLYEADDRKGERSLGCWGRGGSPVGLFLLPRGPPKFRVGPGELWAREQGPGQL